MAPLRASRGRRRRPRVRLRAVDHVLVRGDALLRAPALRVAFVFVVSSRRRPATPVVLLSSLVPQLLRERVQKCYQLEGVNHYQNCKEEVKAYLESIKNVGVHRANIGANDKSPV